ncbi:MAG: N-formylglutamate amidohydrolase [Caulobacterales bacterium]|nr:N-formylglutamate amidohydrolase [Caulobacterales bacterium]
MNHGDGAAADSDWTVFALTPPVGAAAPFVFASPHSGTVVPDDMGADPTLSDLQINSAGDALMDRLIAVGPMHGAPLIAARITRAYVDLNRAPEALDPRLIDGADAADGPKTAAGYGVVPRLTGAGEPLYARRLTLAEAHERIVRAHAPYHAALTEQMKAAKATHGRAVLVDWHSMPGRAGGIDVVLGDRHGTSCRPALTRRLKVLFEKQGFSVALNHPYAGGWSTQAWGRPDEGFEAIQVEISRALYLDAGGGPSAGWGRCAAALNQVIAELLRPGG